MAEASPVFVIDSVEALWPRINRCYRFDNKENRSVPCEPTDDGAKYETSFRMDKRQAATLWKAMKAAYNDKAATQDGWPEKFDNPFTAGEDGTFVFKASLKGAYGKDTTRKPTQYDSRNTVLDEDFMLTTGSTINIAVSFIPYNGQLGTGVSLRLRAVQVIKYAPLKDYSPFGAIDGGFETEPEDVNPFATVEAAAEDAIEEPVKVKTKTAKPTNKKDIDDLVEEWDD